MPELHKADNGYYFYDFIYETVRYKKSTKTKKKADAQDILDNLYRSLQQGANSIAPKVTPTRLDKALPEFVENNMAKWGGKRGGTYQMHLRSQKFLLEFFKDFLITDITGEHLQKYQNHRMSALTQFGKPPTNRTINIELTTLRQLLDHHKLWLKLKDNCKSFRMLKESHDIGKFLLQDQFDALIQACKQINSLALLPAVMLSVLTGLRRDELRHLKWHQVDFIHGLLAVRKSKTDAGLRYINMTDALILLKEWRFNFPDAQPDHYIFPNQKYANTKGGKYGVYQTIPTKPIGDFKGSWKKAKQMAGVSIRWHDLRHTFGTMIGAKGANKADIKALMGHVSDAMMDIYQHSLAESRQRAVSTAFEGWNVREHIQ